MATCAGSKKKMVCEGSVACMPALSCLLLSFSREGFIYHAGCQCFSFVLNIRKTDLKLFSTNRFVCSMHDSQKTKGVRDIMPFQVAFHFS